MLLNIFYYILGALTVLAVNWIMRRRTKENKDKTQVFTNIESKEENMQMDSNEDSQAPLTTTDNDDLNENNNAPDTDSNNRPLIIIIEDDHELAGYMQDQFSQHYSVILEDDGEAGIKQINLHQPNLVITDVVLPSMNGMDICHQLKNTFETSHIPVIMLTAKSEEPDILRGFDCGADCYITKPFNIKILIAQVDSLIRSRQQWSNRLSQSLLMCPNNISITPIDQQFLDRINQILEQELSNRNLDVSALVERLHMGHSTVLRKLKALTGMSPVDYIRSYRMQKAAYIFQKEKLPVSEVSYRVGYADAKYFSKCFTREFKKSPSMYMNDIHK